MPRWKVKLAGKTYTTGELFIEADTWEDAHEIARILDPDDTRIDWTSEAYPDGFHVVAALEAGE